MKNQERIREITPSELSKILKEIQSYGLKMIRYGNDSKYPTKLHAMKSKEYTSLSGCYLIGESLTKVELTTCYNEGFKPTTYVCSLNEKKINTVSGQRAFMQFQRAIHVPSLKALGIENIIHKNSYDGKYALSATPLLGSISDKNTVFSNVYEYDINSAYASVLLQGVPNFSLIEYNRKVRKAEIGFMLNENLSLCYEGEEAEIVVPLETPSLELQKYIFKWYHEKQKGSVEAKAMLNYPIGYYQRTNPFFRAYVVNRCNDVIRAHLNEDVIMWNTDAIFSTKKLDLDIGDKIGQWKERHIKTFKMLGHNYQIEEEIPSYRGIPKEWFENFQRINGRPFDLSKDQLPEKHNKWRMNWYNVSLEEC